MISEKWSNLNLVLLLFFDILATCPSQKSKNILKIKVNENMSKLFLIRNEQLIIINTKDKIVIKFGDILIVASSLDSGKHRCEIAHIIKLLLAVGVKNLFILLTKQF